MRHDIRPSDPAKMETGGRERVQMQVLVKVALRAAAGLLVAKRPRGRGGQISVENGDLRIGKLLATRIVLWAAKKT